MATDKGEVLLVGPPRAHLMKALSGTFTVHSVPDPNDVEGPVVQGLASRLRYIAVGGPPGRVDAKLIGRLPKLEIVSSFGVGYDNVDARSAGERGIVVCNTPDVLNEEVADTAIGLLLCTVRQLPQADRYVRAGKWATQGEFPLSHSLRDRTVGIVGLGRIGRAIARRLEAMQVPVVYHTRRVVADAPYRHYANLLEMAHDANVLLVITPGGAATRNLINAEVLDALGPNGILINMSRGSVVDEPALIQALREGRILTAGLDVFLHEPRVPPELVEMDQVVLFPHLGSASAYTRQAMEQLVADNLIAWHKGQPPLTPVPETPVPARG